MYRKEYRELTSVDNARKIIDQISIEPDAVKMDIEAASGFILAQSITAPLDVPGFDRAAMDGYAVRAKDTYQAREDRPASLKVAGRIEVGSAADVSVHENDAVEVSTGAMMPLGADSVVMVENTRQSGDRIEILHPVSINENVVFAGSDIMIGEMVLETGTLLTSREIGVLAAVGIDKVKVRHLIVGIISTGNELIAPGSEITPGMVFDVNSYSLGSAARECGAIVRHYGIVKDNRDLMEEKLDLAADECHLVLTSGSTSAGLGDIMYQIIAQKGTVLFHGIDIKPGKPVIFGMIKNTPVFGLPGYPTSALTIFNEFVSPLIRSSLGRYSPGTRVKAKMAVDYRPEGRRQLLPVGLIRDFAYPVDKGSAAITTLAYADGFIEIEPRVEIINAGVQVEVTLLGETAPPDILFIGSHCPGFEILARLIPHKVRIINTGSTGALVAVRDGIADLGGIHLPDQDGGYNLSSIRNFGVKDAVLVKGYLREQGLIFREDTDISGFEDIIGLRMINRIRGSGTRMFTDNLLRELAARRGIGFQQLCESLEGYETEARTHSAVGAAVRSGRADVGVGIRPFADLNGLRFIHLSDEEYDFVVRKDFINSPYGRDFLAILCSHDFSSSLPRGIRTYQRTGEILDL